METTKAAALAGAALNLDAWALIDGLLGVAVSRRDLLEKYPRLRAAYPWAIRPTDLLNAWDWHREFGSLWGAYAMAAKWPAIATNQPGARVPGQSEWRGVVRMHDAAVKRIRESVPLWPSEPLPAEVQRLALSRWKRGLGEVPQADAAARVTAERAHGLWGEFEPRRMERGAAAGALDDALTLARGESLPPWEDDYLGANDTPQDAPAQSLATVIAFPVGRLRGR